MRVRLTALGPRPQLDLGKGMSRGMGGRESKREEERGVRGRRNLLYEAKEVDASAHV